MERKEKIKKYIGVCLGLIAGYYLFGDIGLLVGLAILFLWK